MNSSHKLVGRVFGAVLIGLCGVQPAHAYIDPGTGGMILQLLLGGIAGALVVVKLYWHKARSIFSRNSKSTQSTPVELKKDGDA